MLSFLLKLSDLKSDFTLTLGYLNPALNNPVQNANFLRLNVKKSFKEIKFRLLSSYLMALELLLGEVELEYYFPKL